MFVCWCLEVEVEDAGGVKILHTPADLDRAAQCSVVRAADSSTCSVNSLQSFSVSWNSSLATLGPAPAHSQPFLTTFYIYSVLVVTLTNYLSEIY